MKRGLFLLLLMAAGCGVLAKVAPPPPALPTESEIFHPADPIFSHLYFKGGDADINEFLRNRCSIEISATYQQSNDSLTIKRPVGTAAKLKDCLFPFGGTTPQEFERSHQIRLECAPLKAKKAAKHDTEVKQFRLFWHDGCPDCLIHRGAAPIVLGTDYDDLIKTFIKASPFETECAKLFKLSPRKVTVNQSGLESKDIPQELWEYMLQYNTRMMDDILKHKKYFRALSSGTLIEGTNGEKPVR